MAGSPTNLLEGLFTRPTLGRALVVPIIPWFRPGQEAYEGLILPVRKSHVDVFGFTRVFGPVPEELLLQNPEFISFANNDYDHEAYLEGVVRTRTWADRAPDLYTRILLVSHVPSMYGWSDAVAGSRAAPIVTICQVQRSQGGLAGEALRRRVKRWVG